jgi:RNA polymerase sigma factor (sigma-70 family)
LVHPEQAAAQAVAPPQPDPRPVVPPPLGFDDFFRAAWRPLIRTAVVYGATLQEAEDAAAEALTYMLPRWPIPDTPMAYARKAALNYFFKSRTRGDLRVAQRLIERGHVPHHEGDEDGRLTELEDSEWVNEVLSQLSSGQREVLGHVADGLTYKEIAEIIGKSDETVRQRVCAARARLKKILTPGGEYRQPQPEQAPAPREEAR